MQHLRDGAGPLIHVDSFPPRSGGIFNIVFQFPENLCGYAACQYVIWNVFGHHGSRCNHDVAANRDAGEDGHISPDPHVIPDNYRFPMPKCFLFLS